jgi:hypothetical protein
MKISSSHMHYILYQFGKHLFDVRDKPWKQISTTLHVKINTCSSVIKLLQKSQISMALY